MPYGIAFMTRYFTGFLVLGFSLFMSGCQGPLGKNSEGGGATSGGHAGSAKKPPRGFTALANNRDLSGWWGADTEDPRKYMALAPEEFKKKHDESLQDIQKHWRVENDELVNDGKGLYLTTDKNYGD